MMPIDPEPFLLTLRLAVVTTLLLILLGLPLAWWLAFRAGPLKPFIKSLVALPLVLPPTVLGFYLLLVMGASGPLGQLWIRLTGGTLAFTFEALVIGSFIFSLPFVVLPMQSAFESLGKSYMEMAASLRAGPFDRWLSIGLPLIRRSLMTSATLAFAHTLGEFGIVLMIGGNIPGETEVASIAIYNHVEAIEYTQAHILAGFMAIASFLLLLAVNSLDRRPITII